MRIAAPGCCSRRAQQKATSLNVLQSVAYGAAALNLQLCRFLARPCGSLALCLWVGARGQYATSSSDAYGAIALILQLCRFLGRPCGPLA